MLKSNNRALFHLWGKDNLAKHQKVSKYYENDSRYINQQKKSHVLQACSCSICDNAIDKNIPSKSTWNIVNLGKYNFSCGLIVNKLKEMQLFF